MTYGWTLNDEETFPWLLQERLPEYEVVNFGVDGYGTIHSALQFRDALKSKIPKVVVLAYAGFHDQRNTLSRIRRKRLAPNYKLTPAVHPTAWLRNGVLRYAVEDLTYHEFPLMRRLALVHYLETIYNRLEPRWRQRHPVAEALVADMAALAKQHEATFIVANIQVGQGMLGWARSRGIPAVDISVDLDLPQHTNLPHDGHPSAIAARAYADRLDTFLRANILDQTKPGRSQGEQN